jgi:hypothetical protein
VFFIIERVFIAAMIRNICGTAIGSPVLRMTAFVSFLPLPRCGKRQFRLFGVCDIVASGKFVFLPFATLSQVGILSFCPLRRYRKWEFCLFAICDVVASGKIAFFVIANPGGVKQSSVLSF